MPANSTDITLEWLHENWSHSITAFTTEPVVAETRPGVEKADGGGASGPAIVRLVLQWAGDATGETPATAVLKISDNKQDPHQPMLVRAVCALAGFHPAELNANEWIWYANNSAEARQNGYTLPKCYAAVASHSVCKKPGMVGTIVFDRRIPYRTVLVLEDLSEYKSYPQQANLEEALSDHAVRNCARLHASYWGRWSSAHNPAWLEVEGSGYGACVWLRDLVLGCNTSQNIGNKSTMQFHKGGEPAVSSS